MIKSSAFECFGFGCWPPCGVDAGSPERLPRRRRGVWGPQPYRTGSFRYGQLARGPVAERAVRTTLIVVDAPALQDNVRFAQIAEEFGLGIRRAACRESSRYAHFPKDSRA